MIQRVIEIVEEASTLMLPLAYGTEEAQSIKITQKEGYANIVTSSDVLVQHFLCRELSLLLPQSGFLCEEEDAHDLSQEYTWIIDPIDGTANYSRGIRECAICVALKRGDAVQLSVVYMPRTDELFMAERGKGAFLQHPQSKAPSQQIRVSERSFEDSILCTALSVYHKEYTKICSDIVSEAFLQCNDIRRFGAAAPELCFLAMGRCELYFEYLLSPWDFAAASLILQEAGGVLCNLDGNPLDLTQPTGVLAANNLQNLARLLSIVRRTKSRNGHHPTCAY